MSLSLDDIQSLAEEIRHLVEAGLPLETALSSAAAGRGARLQKVADEITAELGRGRSLEQIVASQQIGPARMLCAALGAGIQSNSLPLTIELMGDFASDLIELRGRLLQAAAYPLIVVALAGLLLTGILSTTLQQMLAMISEWQLPVNRWLLSLLELHQAAPWWTWLIPVGLVMVVCLWTMSGRAAAMSFRGPERLLLLIPGIGTLVRDLRYYTLARMLSLLTERGVPLTESLVLSGATSGSRRLDAACQTLATTLRGGGLTRAVTVPNGATSSGKPASSLVPPGLPALLGICLIQTSQSEERLVRRLRSVALFYRHRLERNASWIRLLLPLVLFVVVGGGTALMYCGIVFWPVTEIYQHLGQ